MAIDNLGIRFSEDVYASRSQVAHTLGTNLIDPFWNQILLYRKSYQADLGIRDISKMPYTVTLCKSVTEKCVALSQKIERYSVSYNEKINKSLNKNTYHRNTLRQELIYVAKANNIYVNEIALNNIIYHRSNDPVFVKLINYLAAAEYVYASKDTKITDSYVANLYSYLTGEKELTSFYRVDEINSSTQKAIINREYAGAPVNQIESLMDSLFMFINNYNASPVVKAAVVYYMINYIKPFDNYNAEMSVLLARKLLSNNDSSQLFVPFASLLVENQSNIALAIRESQRSRDLTYVLVEFISILSNAFQYSLDDIARLLVEGAQQSYLMGEDEEKIEKEFGPEPVKKEEEYVTKVEEVKQEKVIEQPKVVTKKVEKEPQKPVEVVRKVNVEQVEISLTDKELKLKAEELLESDPMLRPNQAHFYVRHCTMGHYYTIQQYKRAERCVYETARTSMDNLAKQGYYKREQVKNKFVYTPLAKD